jgi:hypothetical protein
LLSDKGLANPGKPAPAAPAPGPAARTPVRPVAYVAELAGPSGGAANPAGPKAAATPTAKANAKAKAKAKAPAATTTPAAVQKVPLTITWATGMKFYGQSTNLQGQPAGRAEFYDHVRADMEDSSLACEDVMRVFLDRTVKLNNRARERTAATEGQAAEPQADIAVIELVEKVVVIDAKRDPLDPRTIVQKQRIEGNYLIYDKATGNFRVPGAGQVFLWDRGDDSSLTPQLGLPGAKPKPEGNAPGTGTRPSPPAPLVNPAPDPGSARVIRPTAGPPPRSRTGQGQTPAVVGHNSANRGVVPGQRVTKPKPEKLPMTVTQVKFSRDMIGRFGTGKETDKTETRWADFFGDIEALHGPVADTDGVLDADHVLEVPGASLIASQVLRVISDPDRTNPDAPTRYWMKAWENATVTTDDKTIQADTVTFDSAKSLFYAYGDDGRDVVIAQQAGVGQGASNMQGRAAWYNNKTGEAQIVEPKTFALLDQNTGKRPAPLPPASPDLELKRPKRLPFRNQRATPERQDFNGH